MPEIIFCFVSFCSCSCFHFMFRHALYLRRHLARLQDHGAGVRCWTALLISCGNGRVVERILT